MCQCRYVILDLCQSDLSSGGTPCLLLLNVDIDSEKRQFKIFVTPIIRTLFDGISNHNYEWVLGVLSDLYRYQNLSEIDDESWNQFCLLSIGPLQTSLCGSIETVREGTILDSLYLQMRELWSGVYSQNQIHPLNSFQEFNSDILAYQRPKPEEQQVGCQKGSSGEFTIQGSLVEPI